MMADMEALRDALAAIPGVASCKVGIERNISPADYPLIRVVPVRIIPGKPYQAREAEMLVYFGAATASSEGEEDVFAALFALEGSILASLRSQGHRYRETVVEQDQENIKPYKHMAVRVDVVGVTPVPAPPAPAPAPPPA